MHRAAILMAPSGFIAVLAGWVTTEVGRQPWIVYGLLRTAQSASPIEVPAVAASLIAFVVVYFILFGAGTITIWDAAAPPSSLAFLLVGAAILIPLILAYTSYS